MEKNYIYMQKFKYSLNLFFIYLLVDNTIPSFILLAYINILKSIIVYIFYDKFEKICSFFQEKLYIFSVLIENKDYLEYILNICIITVGLFIF